VSFIIKLLMRVFSLLPLPAVHFLGTMIGYCFYLIPNKRRSTTITNLNLCFPEYSSAQKKALLRRSLVETGKGALETSGLWLWSSKRVLRLIKAVHGYDLLEQTMAAGKGCIIAAPHLGSWEIIGLYVSQQFPMTCLYRPPPLAGMDNFMQQARARLGTRLAPTDRSGVKTLLAILKNGEIIGILPDQDPSSGIGLFAPFFGIQANTMTLLSKLANKTGAVVFFSYAERLSFGRGYHLHFIKGSADINDQDTLKSCTAINSEVEKLIRTLPEQYLWCYKRFRSRPEGEATFYKK